MSQISPVELSFSVFSLRVSEWSERICIDAPLEFSHRFPPHLRTFTLFSLRLNLRERFPGWPWEEPGAPGCVLGGGGGGEELAQPGERRAAGRWGELGRGAGDVDPGQLQGRRGGRGLLTEIIIQVHVSSVSLTLTFLPQQIEIYRPLQHLQLCSLCLQWLNWRGPSSNKVPGRLEWKSGRYLSWPRNLSVNYRIKG